MDKIKNFFLVMRTIEKKISLKDKRFKVYVIKDTFARTAWGGYIISEDFFRLNKKAQLACLLHEEYHQKSFTKFKLFINIIRFLSFRKANWQEEFNADVYSALKGDKKATLSLLLKAKELYKTGRTAYNKRTHPPIEERIRRIQELK